MIAALPHRNCIILRLEVGEVSTEHSDLLRLEVLETAARQLHIPILNFKNDWIDSILLNDLLEKLKSFSEVDKTCLLISGKYLEEQVTVCALEALAQGFDVYRASPEGFEGGVSQIIYKVACAICVQQRKVAAVQIPTAARKLEMKTMHRKNRNLQQLHSISQISSSAGLERQYNEIGGPWSPAERRDRRRCDHQAIGVGTSLHSRRMSTE